MKYLLDTDKIRAEIHRQHYTSLEDFAEQVGMHKNTIWKYLKTGEFLPRKLAVILDALDIDLRSHIKEKNSRNPQLDNLKILASILPQVMKILPATAFFLFGSRTKGNFHKYADFDLGFYGESPDDCSLLKLRDLQEEFDNSTSYSIDIVDFSRVTEDFKKEALSSAYFLGGEIEKWVEINSYD